MDFVEGQGVLGRIRFVDGEFPMYDRTYLIVTVEKEYIEVLNVSSIKGKERKLAYPTNKRLVNFKPPFVMPSFVKLDSLTRVERADWGKLKILNAGRTLNNSELEKIKEMVKSR